MDKKLIGGSQSKGSSRTLMTGLAPVTVVAVNPTAEEFNKITGYETKREFNYDIVDFGEGNTFRPLQFLVYNETTGYTFMRMLFSNEPQKTRAGDKQTFVDVKGQITYYAASAEDILNNPKVTWYEEPLRPACKGEVDLFTFLQALIRYSPRAEDAQFLIDMENVGYTPEKIMKGDVTSIQKIIDFANEYQNQVVVPFVVKTTEEGNYQEILTKRQPYFWAVENLSKAEESFVKIMDEIDTDRTWSVEFKEFSSSAPEEVATADEAPF